MTGFIVDGRGWAAAKAATLTERFVYLRCSDCGEVWAIPERREFPRPRNPWMPEVRTVPVAPVNGS